MLDDEGLKEKGYTNPENISVECNDSSFRNMDVYEIYKALYGTDMPGSPNSEDSSVNKLVLENGICIEVYNNLEYTGKKQKPIVSIYYKDEYFTSEKKGKVSVKYKNNKNAGTATVTIKKLKSPYADANESVKGKTIDFEILPYVVSDNCIRTKIKNGQVKSVKVLAQKKYKKIPKSMWSVNGSEITFTGNYKGTVSFNEII